jgi:hypothetical protein
MRRLETLSEAPPPEGGDDALHHRIRSEFAEMPGLRLTLRQASRLFDIEPTHCLDVLTGLVADGILAVSYGVFVRAGAGRRQA